MAIFLAILLTALRELPEPPTLPSEDSPTPYTLDIPLEIPAVHTLVTPRRLTDKSTAERFDTRLGDFTTDPIAISTHVHFDIRGFPPDSIFAVEDFITSSSPIVMGLNTLYEDWSNAAALARRPDDFNCRALETESFQSLVNSPSTIRLTSLDGAKENLDMLFRGYFGTLPIIAWYLMRSPMIVKTHVDLLSQALLYRKTLARFQGTLVPRFIGFYLAQTWAIMVVEDPGRPLSIPKDLVFDSERCVTI
jgi:hypothetical protein